MTSTIKSINEYEIEISQGYEFEKLQKLWLSIKLDQDLPFFLSWSWISCWIKTYDPKLLVVTAMWDTKIVAIGLFTCSIDYRHGFIKSFQYRLHQMGDALLDQIWMEYNDFICVKEHKISAVNACIDALQKSDLVWDEIILSMMAASRAKEVRKSIQNSHIFLTNPCYTANLGLIKQDSESYISTLSSNTRYQINRSIKRYKKLYGDLSLVVAQSSEQALKLFLEAGEYHISRWHDSGYKNKKFIQFHENLIRNSFDKKFIDIMKISAGDTLIGILYFHLMNNRVYFYLQGLNYECDKKLKPGLVAHTIASQYYLEQGMDSYDFMGGYSQYKCQLATRTEDLVSVCIQKPRLKFFVEKVGQRVKRLIRNINSRRIN